MLSLFLHDIWKVLVYSLILGAGLPVVYALGVRASAIGTPGADSVDGGGSLAVPRGRHLLGRTLAVICYAVVLAGIGLGLAFIVASGHGEQLSFEHGYPTFVPKG